MMGTGMKMVRNKIPGSGVTASSAAAKFSVITASVKSGQGPPKHSGQEVFAPLQ